LITSKGIRLEEAYLGAAGVLTGSARLSQEARERTEKQITKEEIQRKKLTLDHRRKSIEAQIEALRAGFKTEEEEFERVATTSRLKDRQIENDRLAMAKSRKVAGTKIKTN
jgi:circadian clock protein KaiC